MTRLKASLFTAICLGASATAAAAQEPTRVTIDLSTAGVQPGAPPSNPFTALQSGYTPPAPQRAFPNERPGDGWGGLQSAALTKGYPGMSVTETFDASKLLAVTRVRSGLKNGKAFTHTSLLFLMPLPPKILKLTTQLSVTGPVAAAPGLLVKGQAFANAPVARSETGRLKAPLDRIAGRFSGIPDLPVGTPMFALAMDGAVDILGGDKTGETMWCAQNDSTSDAGRHADCFVPNKTALAAASGYKHWTLSPTRNGHDQVEPQDGVIRSLAVELTPVDDRAPMSGAFRFDGWSKSDLRLDFALSAGAAPSVISHMTVKRDADGSAAFRAFNRLFRFTPSGPKGQDATVAEVKEGPMPGSLEALIQSQDTERAGRLASAMPYAPRPADLMSPAQAR